MLLDEDVTDEDKDMLRRTVASASDNSALYFKTVYGEFQDAHVERGIPRTAYYRLLIPWLLPQYDRVIYSDVDIIFKGNGVGALYEQFDMEGLYVAGAARASYMRQTGILHRHIVSLGLDPEKYINDGFILINSFLQRKDNLLEAFRRHSTRVLKLMDQDVINIVCRGKIGYFGEQYNATPLSVATGDVDRYHVLHFVGNKPWNMFCPGWGEWWEAYRASAVFDKKYCESTIDMQSQKMKTYVKNEELLGSSFVLRNMRRVLWRLKELPEKLRRRM